MTALVGGHLHFLGLVTGGGLAHQIRRLQELCFLARVRPDGPGHLGRGTVQPGRAWRCLSLV